MKPTCMSNDHSLERLVLICKTSFHLLFEATLVEVESFDLQTKALSHGGLGITKEVYGLSKLERELRKALPRKGLQRLGSESGGDELREGSGSASGDQTFLVHLGLRGSVVHGKGSVESLAAEQDKSASVEVEESELLAGNVALQLREGVLIKVGIDEPDGI